MNSPALPEPDTICDGGDLDCGSGLLLIIRKAMQPLGAGRILEVRSREGSVKEDLPAWCRLVGHTMVAIEPADNNYHHYSIRKKGADEELAQDFAQARDYEWRVRARWTGGMRATVFARNHSFVVGQPASFDTQDEHACALEHLLGAVAADLAVGFQWRASQKSIEVYQLEISLSARVDNILVFLGVEDDGHPGLLEVRGKAFIDADSKFEDLDTLWRETIRRAPIVRTLCKGVEVQLEMKQT